MGLVGEAEGRRCAKVSWRDGGFERRQCIYFSGNRMYFGGTFGINHTPLSEHLNRYPSRSSGNVSTRSTTGVPRRAPTSDAVCFVADRCTSRRVPGSRPCRRIDAINFCTVPWKSTGGGVLTGSFRSTSTECPCAARIHVRSSLNENRCLSLSATICISSS